MWNLLFASFFATSFVRASDIRHQSNLDIDCGTVAAPGDQLQTGVRSATQGSVPWHAVVYTKRADAYSHICGGSLVTHTAVISAALCFWQDRVRPASDYAVAVGKIYRAWNDPRDVNAQKSDVSDIKVPPRFHGYVTNDQDDMAIVFLKSAVQYNKFVKPVCVNFEDALDMRQLQNGNFGKVTSWGLTEGTIDQSLTLKIVDVPYVDITQCFAETPSSFQKYMTSDKICAGFENGTAVCRGDGGAGLVFPEIEQGTVRHYLRGVLSVTPVSVEYWCSPSYPLFTQITKHESFITNNLN